MSERSAWRERDEPVLNGPGRICGRSV